MHLRQSRRRGVLRQSRVWPSAGSLSRRSQPVDDARRRGVEARIRQGEPRSAAVFLLPDGVIRIIRPRSGIGAGERSDEVLASCQDYESQEEQASHRGTFRSARQLPLGALARWSIGTPLGLRHSSIEIAASTIVRKLAGETEKSTEIGHPLTIGRKVPSPASPASPFCRGEEGFADALGWIR
jgi:hypothetical protein